MNPQYWDIVVEYQYNEGSLYSWLGDIIHDCSETLIKRTVRRSQSLIVNLSKVGKPVVAWVKEHLYNGEIETLVSVDGRYDDYYIPLTNIDRDGLPATGETIEKPYINR